MPEKLVTLTTFHSPVEAELARNRLGEEGIPAFLTDEAGAGLFGASLGTIKLQVVEADVCRAREVLAALREGGGEGGDDPAAVCATAKVGTACPRCGAPVGRGFRVCLSC